MDGYYRKKPKIGKIKNDESNGRITEECEETYICKTLGCLNPLMKISLLA